MNNIRKINYLQLILLVSGFLSFSFLKAQEKIDSEKKDNSFFKFSASYLTNSVYNGRKDSLPTPYISPTIGYFNKSGFHIAGSFSYLSSSTESRIDLFGLNMGYDFNFSDKFSGSLEANKDFYNQASTSIKSDVKGSLGASFSYDFDFVQLNAGTDISFATKVDLGVTAGLSHAFSIGDEKNPFTITPALVANFSTLHFYEGYTNRKITKRTKKQNSGLLSSVSTTTVNNNNFTLLDYELSVPLAYDFNKMGLFLTPTFAIPQNPIYTTTTTTNKFSNGTQTIITSNSTPSTETKLSNTFFIELGLYIKF